MFLMLLLPPRSVTEGARDIRAKRVPDPLLACARPCVLSGGRTGGAGPAVPAHHLFDQVAGAADSARRARAGARSELPGDTLDTISLPRSIGFVVAGGCLRASARHARANVSLLCCVSALVLCPALHRLPLIQFDALCAHFAQITSVMLLDDSMVASFVSFCFTNTGSVYEVPYRILVALEFPMPFLGCAL